MNNQTNDLKLQLYSLWCRHLEIEEFEENEDFFFLGGDSLSATMLINDIEEMLKIQLSIGLLYEHAVFSDFYQIISNKIGNN